MHQMDLILFGTGLSVNAVSSDEKTGPAVTGVKMECAFCPKQRVDFFFFFFRGLVLDYDRLGRGSKSYDLRVEESCSLWGHVGDAVRIQTETR